MTPEFLSELLTKLVDLVAKAIESPGLWSVAAVAGVASVSLPFLKQMYGVHQREKTRMHIADHVAGGRISPETAVVLLAGDEKLSSSAEGFHTAGWMLGPVGVVMLIAGIWLGRAVHPGLFGLVLGGAISLALSLSFIVIATAKRRTQETSDSPTVLRASQPLDIEVPSESPSTP
jgi:hypothetical protein